MKELINKITQKKVPNIFNLDTISTWNEAIDTSVAIIKQEQMMKDGLDENGLKFCPFCGHQVHMFGDKDYVEDEPHYNIQCKNCKVTITHATGKKEDVITKWNTRS